MRSLFIKGLTLAVVTLVIIGMQPLAAQESPYVQGDYLEWKEMFLDGEHQKLVADLEKNMGSSDPHPFVYQAWIATQSASGNIEEAIKNADPRWKSRVELIHSATVLYDADLDYQIYELLNSSDINELDEFMGASISYALDDIDPQMVNELLLTNITTGTATFRTYWALIDLLSSQEQSRKFFVSALKDGSLSDYPYAVQVIQTIGVDRHDETTDKIILVQEYPDFEEDALAKRYLGLRLESIDWFTEAKENYLQSLNANPFYGFNLRNITEMDVRLKNFESARERISKYASAFAPENPTLFTVREWAWGLFEGGELGKARKVLEANREQLDRDADLSYLMGRIESAGDYREEYAAEYFRQATLLEPRNLRYRQYYLEELIGMGDITGVLDEYELLADEFEALNMTIYQRLAGFYVSEGEPEYALDFMDMALEYFQTSGWMRRYKAQVLMGLEEYGESNDLLRESHEYYLPYSWTLNQIVSNLENLGYSADQIETELRAIMDTHPWSMDVWNVLARNQVNNQQKLEVYKEGMEKYPAEFEFYYRYASTIGDEQKTYELYKAYEANQSEKARPYNRRYLHNMLAQNIIFSMSAATLDTTRLNEAQKYFDAYHTLYGDRSWYYNRMYFGYRDVNLRDEAGDALEKLMIYEPDNLQLAFNIPARFNDQINNPVALFFQFVQRNPYDFDRWDQFIHYHAKWNGSPINAISAYEIVKERFPDDLNEVKADVASAYSELGSNIRHFEDVYARATSIAQSERYVGWYLSAKRDVWKSSTEVSFDWESNTATILFEDGTTAKRSDDPVTGQPTLIQVGNTFIRAEYDPVTGLVTHIENSGDEKVIFEYAGRKISRVKLHDKIDLQFKYRAESEKMEQVILIEDARIDTMFIEYDENDKITSTRAGETSESGATLRITGKIQEMLALTRYMNNGARQIANGRLPDLGLEDEKVVALRDAVYDAGTYEEERLAELELAIYLSNNTRVNAAYASEAYSYLEELFIDREDLEKDDVLQVVKTYYNLLREDKVEGVDSRKWQIWDQMQEWVIVENAIQSDNDELSSFYAEMKQSPIRILPSAAWLPKSILQNSSYWKHYEPAQMVKPEYLEDFTLNTILYRENGDIVVGTSKGLLINQYGYWEHLMYNALSRSFVNEVDNDRLRATSDVLSLAEENGYLFVGTADGLIVLSEYKERSVEVLNTRDELPADRIEHLERSRGFVYAGGSQGAAAINAETLEVTPYPDMGEITFFDVFEGQDVNYIAIGTSNGVFVSTGEGNIQITDTPRKDGLITGNGILYLLSQDQVTRVDVLSEDKLELSLSGELITTDAGQVFGLAAIPVYENEWALFAYTDLGLSIFYEQRFEHFYIDQESKPQVREYSMRGMDFGLITNSGISVFDHSSYQTYEKGVDEIETVGELGLTFFTDGQNPKYIFHDDPEAVVQELDEYSYMSSTSLAVDKENRLIVNDGLNILRYSFDREAGGYDTEELFYASSVIPDDRRLYQTAEVQNIKVDSSGVVWVANNLSVFKYEESSGVPSITEFSFFEDPGSFPCITDMISSVQIDASNNVFVVCSRESHRSYKGRSMVGGLLKYDRENDRFDVMAGGELNYNWFINSVTDIGEGVEIIGTNSGFAKKQNGITTALRGSMGSESYQALMDEHPALFFGTKGANIGDVWLFGSASGVIGYYDENWFYPEQLNRLLPGDIEFGNYGGRHVNDLTTDPNGRVYVGTDLGLLVYDPGSSDPTQFLMENFNEERSIEYFNTKLLENQRDRVISLKDLPEEHQATEILNNLKQNQQSIQLLFAQKENAQNTRMVIGASDGNVTVDQDSLDREIEILNQRQNELLLTLEQREPAIFQAVQIDPLDLRASRDRMQDGDVIVQYIPMPKKMYIQLIAKDQSSIFEVNISREQLVDSILAVSQDLAYQSENMRVGELVSRSYTPMEAERFEGILSYLYEMLIRPVETSLEAYRNVYIAPVSTLNYLPFGALIDRENERKFTYAVEKFNIGYVSSLYLFQLINDGRATGNSKALFFGDPDGTLPGAREEVASIQSLYPGSTSYYGEDADSDKLMRESQGNDVIHLATHGFLNDNSLKDSWLLFSDKKMKLSEIYNLRLTGTSMVVLSACQTSLGGEGLEYSTLARAFVNTGVPTILGTLWSVDDEASKELMVNFYQNMNAGQNKFEAMAQAQRSLIDSRDPALNHPSKWASYIVIGKP